MALRLPGKGQFKPVKPGKRRPPLAATQPAPGISQVPISHPPKPGAAPRPAAPAGGKREWTTKWLAEGSGQGEGEDGKDDYDGEDRVMDEKEEAAVGAAMQSTGEEEASVAPPTVSASAPARTSLPPSRPRGPSTPLAGSGSTPAKRAAKPLLAAVAVAGASSTPVKHGKSRSLRAPLNPTESSPSLAGDVGREATQEPETAGVVAPPTEVVVSPTNAPTTTEPDAPPPEAASTAVDSAQPQSTPTEPPSVAPTPAAAAVDSTAIPPPVVSTDDMPPSVVPSAPPAPPPAPSPILPPTVSIDDAPPSVVPAPVPVPAPVTEPPPPVGAASTDVTPEAGLSTLPDLPPQPITDPADLAAAAVASITPTAPPRGRKRRGGQRAKAPPAPSAVPREPGDNVIVEIPSMSPAARPKRATRTTKSAAIVDDGSAGESDGAPEPDGSEGTARKRQRKTKTRPPTRRPSQRSQPKVNHPELDGVEAEGMVGEEINVSELSLSDLAMISRGRVSARTLKLHQFQRAEEERKNKERLARAEANWKKRQVIRRKAREIKNTKRAERRAAATAAGKDPADVVSDDSADSEEEYEALPERLTPPSSPSYFGRTMRVAPVVLDPEERAAVESATNSGRKGAAATTAPDEDEEDIEGLGLNRHARADDEDDEDPMEEHEVLGDDFQLEVEDDGQPPEGEFAGLGAGAYTGGHFDDEGNWVEGNEQAGLVLQRRNEETRRRILDGDHDRQVEVVDNDTQFINSSTWGKKVNNERWTVEETELFFNVIRETGENYTLMKAYFPGRSVRQLRKKGMRENKLNPERMNDAVMNRKPMDKKYLAKSAGFNDDEPYDREVKFLEDLRIEQERQAALDREAALAKAQQAEADAEAAAAAVADEDMHEDEYDEDGPFA